MVEKDKLITLPGVIDPHVHCRDGVHSYKESYLTASRAAAAGGVSLIMDMPNNPVLVTSLEQIREKQALARPQTVVDIGFHLGTLGEESQNFKAAMSHVLGLKIFLSLSTGGHIITDPAKRRRAFRNWESDAPILVHAEDETLKIPIDLAAEYNRTLYVCHMSKASELDLLRRAKDKRPDRVFGEVTPHHLFLTDFGPDPLAKMKPPLTGFIDKAALWAALNDGTLDVVGTDHAPHTLGEKYTNPPAYGVPGLETTLPLLLAAERNGEISLDRIKAVTHDNPLKIFGLEEQPDTFVIVRRDQPYTIEGRDLQTLSKWTPFSGIRVLDRVQLVVLRNQVIYQEGQVLAKPGSGRILPGTV